MPEAADTDPMESTSSRGRRNSGRSCCVTSRITTTTLHVEPWFTRGTQVGSSLSIVPYSPDIDFGRSVFLCSKPLQVLNCASIVRHAGIADARLHVLTSAIDDADGFRSFLLGSGHAALFSSIEWDRDIDEALGGLEPATYDSLFVEDDRLRAYLRVLPYRTRRLVLSEEGIGTYRNNPELALRGLRRLKWKLLAATRGCGWEFGEGRRTDLVMVVHPDAFGRLKPHLAHKARPFPGLIDELRHERVAWREIVEPALGVPPGPLGNVALVVATWGGASAEVLSAATAGADLVIYKAHPHDSAAAAHEGVVEVAGSWIPAEALIEHLAERTDRLTVYHSSSSVGLYARDLHGNVTLVDVLNAPHVREVLAALDG